MKSAFPIERIEQMIFIIRGQKVMLSPHLAGLYGVEPRALIQAVMRNRERFPGDFMFQLTRKEFENLKSQIVISSWGGMRRAAPYAFTEEGVAMLSSVLRNKRAVQANIAIMRAFVRLRLLVSANRDLAGKLAELERKVASHDDHIRSLFRAIRELMKPDGKKVERIGFKEVTGDR
jgi:hypothetical protein